MSAPALEAAPSLGQLQASWDSDADRARFGHARAFVRRETRAPALARGATLALAILTTILGIAAALP